MLRTTHVPFVFRMPNVSTAYSEGRGEHAAKLRKKGTHKLEVDDGARNGDGLCLPELAQSDGGNEDEEDRGQQGKKSLLKEQGEVEAAMVTQVGKRANGAVAAGKACPRRGKEARPIGI